MIQTLDEFHAKYVVLGLHRKAAALDAVAWPDVDILAVPA